MHDSLTEGFYKWYDHYPFLLEDSISLANLGADFGIVGNAPVNSTSRGRSYGVELMLQQKLFEGFYGIASYTFVRSESENGDNRFTSSSWDNRHLVSLTGGKRFQKNWELGVRWLFTGGSPFTPYNIQETVRRENWDVRPYGIPDYTATKPIANQRLPSTRHPGRQKILFSKMEPECLRRCAECLQSRHVVSG